MAGRILIADSIANNRISLKATLAAEYFETTCVSDAEEMSEAVLKFQPDIILMSTHLGRADGYAICKQLKLNADSAHISVMMYASTAAHIDWGKALINLVDDIQLFPLNRIRMVSRLRQMHRNKVELDTLKNHANASNDLGFSDVAVDISLDRLSSSKIACIQSDTRNQSFVVAPSIGKSYTLPYNTTPADVAPCTDLILLMGADNQCQLLSNLKANPATKSIPIICLVPRIAAKKINRVYELGGEDCLFDTVPHAQINTRIQSVINLHHQKDHLRSLLDKRVKEACIDPLTGIFNRRHAQNYLTTCFSGSSETGRNLVAMMLDIDKFKTVNDTLGHVNGDLILKEIASRLNKSIRGVDMVARMGGEEFLILIPDATLDRALEIAERLRQVIEQKPFNLMAGKISQKVTVSIGLAKKTSRHLDADALVHSADLALYKAKAKGRNCISVSAA
jgi:two-component system cell cycle response regulator